MEDKQQGEEQVPLLYPDLPTFVEKYIAVIYGLGPPVGTYWCPKWWEHPPAAIRLDALWKSFEAGRVDGDGAWLASWLAYTADPIMAWLQSDRGPFRECSNTLVTVKIAAYLEILIDVCWVIRL